jgi:hypothetical protein
MTSTDKDNASNFQSTSATEEPQPQEPQEAAPEEPKRGKTSACVIEIKGVQNSHLPETLREILGNFSNFWDGKNVVVDMKVTTQVPHRPPITHLGVLIGVWITTGFFSLFQDALGKERYIEVIRQYWVTGYISVPVALALLVLCGILIFASQKVYESENSLADFKGKSREAPDGDSEKE